MEQLERPLNEELIYTGCIFDIKKYQIQLENGHEALREVVVHHGGACVVALNEAGELLMERQFRFPTGEVLWELPAGKLEPGENPMLAAGRELEEETGYAAGELELLTTIRPAPAYCTEVIHLYRARDLRPTQQNLDPDEYLSVEWVPLERAAAMVLSGEITDAKTQVGILLTLAQAGDRAGGRP